MEREKDKREKNPSRIIKIFKDIYKYLWQLKSKIEDLKVKYLIVLRTNKIQKTTDNKCGDHQ